MSKPADNKKDHGPARAAGTVRPVAGSGWRLAGLIVLFAVLGTGSVVAWRSHRLAVRVQAGLPAQPDLTSRPAVLAQLVAAATDQTKSNRTALDGVAALGRLYHANGFVHEAEACWRLLQREQPREARWPYYLADLRRTESDYAGMAALLGEAVALAPDYAPAALQLADLQFKTGQSEKAEVNYRHRLALLPRDPYARLGLVRIALQRGQRDEAKEILVELIKDSPQFSPGHNLYAEMLAADGNAAESSRQRWLGRETGRFREADDPWLEELQASCYDSKRLCVWGTIDFQTEHGDRGKSFFERAIRYRPDDIAGYELLGTLDLKLGDPAKARETLEAGLRRPNTSKPSPMYFVNLSHAYRELKQPTDAVRVAREGLQLTGQGFELYDALGVALGESGNYDEAIAALDEALARNANDSNANYNLALCLLAVGREDDAVHALKRSLVLQPTFPKALILLGRRELDAGRWEAAEAYVRPLYESHPEMPEVRQLAARWRLQAGKAAELKGDLVAAERQYRNGLAIDGHDAELEASLGTLYLVQHKIVEAVPLFETYHRMQPTNPRSSLFLGQVYAMTGRIAEARKILTEGAQMAERDGNTTTAGNCREILQNLPPADAR